MFGEAGLENVLLVNVGKWHAAADHRKPETTASEKLHITKNRTWIQVLECQSFGLQFCINSAYQLHFTKR